MTQISHANREDLAPRWNFLLGMPILEGPKTKAMGPYGQGNSHFVSIIEGSKAGSPEDAH